METRHVFLGFGECMVELASTEQPSIYKQGFAGDVFNTLWYAARWLGPDWQVRMHTALGTDQLSEELAAFAAQAGIDCAQAPRIAGAMPGLYMIRLDKGERRFFYWRGQSAARRMLQDRDLVARQIAQAKVIYLSGITLAILPPDDRAHLIEMIGHARSQGKLIAFDPNIRPALWENRDALRLALTQAASASSVTLPSFDDEQTAFGDTTPEATIARYKSAGSEMVVVKNGAHPVFAGDAGNVLDYPTPALSQPMVDSTAAGDSFNAGFLAAWLRGETLDSAIRAGQKLAGQVIRAHGALVQTA
jgi:2-dehydro-3-deoxygluconokinase